jgi:ParB/RepB/Spo0J family partition protein
MLASCYLTAWEGLMESATSISEMTRANFQAIPIDRIKSSPHQARKLFDQDSIKALAESMRAESLLQPITVRRLIAAAPSAGAPEGTEEVDKSPFYFELIAGERRLRAAKLLGWMRIDAKVIQTISDGEAAAKGLIENLQREDLNPVEEAEGFGELSQLDPNYWNQEKIAQIAGKKQSYISDSLGLLALPDPIKENIRRRIISRSHGVELSRLPTPEAQLEASKAIEGLNRQEARKVIKQHKGLKVMADPLQAVWEQANKDRKKGSFKVQYTKAGQWTFNIRAGRDQERALTDIANLISQLAAAIQQYRNKQQTL